MKKLNLLLSLLVGACLLTGCSEKPAAPSPAPDPPQSTPAQALDLPGCENCYKVSEDYYSGAQPTEEGFGELEKLGIKTIVSLRSLHSDRDELEGTNLNYIRIRMEAWDLELDETREFLATVTNPANQPVFVHCLHGADRTGTMTAVWRMVVEGWTKEKAIEEMTKGPFGFHEIFDGLPEFLEDLDIETLRKEFGKEYPSEN